ncbi:MAG: T9SS type A sorting domain-containing protein [Flavobacteriales bacterium]|nr:T9SS type A sorting domain-containing protein [Flavobacteriales bacterium]
MSKLRTFVSILFIGFAIMVAPALIAQEKCGVNYRWEQLKKADPFRYKIYREQLARHNHQGKEIGMRKAITDTTYIIPIVFHIVHNNGSEKISEAQVLDALRILNNDFNLRNSDTNTIVDPFKDIVANIKFEFRLAQLDPSGNCTNGINYYESADHYKGGQDATWTWVHNQWPKSWRYDSYLNVITNRSVGGTYSYGPTTDVRSGVMIDHSLIGLIGTGTGDFWERTLTHEVGHWFNLDHTWGGGTDAESAGNCNTDDGVGDTPNCKGTYGCNNNRNSCDDGPGDIKDNVQNYMDYGCSIMFTEGQKTKMINSLLSNTQKNLFTEGNLILTGTQAPYEYSSDPCSVSVSILVEDNYLMCADNSASFIYQVNNADVDSVLWSFPNGVPATSEEDSPEVIYSNSGYHKAYFTAYTTAGILMDSTMLKVVTTDGGRPHQYSIDFENNTVFNNDFLIVNTQDGVSGWGLDSSVSYGGSTSLKLINNSSFGLADIAYGPLLDFSSLVDDEITFSFMLSTTQVDSSEDRLRIYFSKICGEIWNKFYDKTGASLSTFTSTTAPFEPTSNSDWRLEQANIPAGYAVSDVMFKFDFTSGRGNSLFIDNINLALVGLNDVKLLGQSLRIYPNPVGVSSVIEFDLTNSKEVSIEVYDVLGRKLSGKSFGKMPKGNHRLQLGNTIPSKKGIYIIKTNLGDKVISQRVVRD